MQEDNIEGMDDGGRHEGGIDDTEGEDNIEGRDDAVGGHYRREV